MYVYVHMIYVVSFYHFRGMSGSVSKHFLNCSSNGYVEVNRCCSDDLHNIASQHLSAFIIIP